MLAVQTLSVRLLGAFQLHHAEQRLEAVLTPRLQAFLACILLHPHAAPSRQQLAYTLWGDTSERQARANLRKMVYRLRQSFPAIDDYLDLDGPALSPRPEAPLWLDVAEFNARLQAAGEQETPALLTSAVELYTGDLLPDLYDEWLLPLREQLRRRYLRALDRLGALLEARREHAAATKVVRQLLAADPLRESGYRRLMRLQALSGDVAAALHTYHRCAALLEQELGVEPSPATQEAYRRLLNRQAAPPAQPAVPAHRQIPLIGRNQSWQILLAAWKAAAAGTPQVVLVSGEAGIGKTRLAEELLRWTRRQGIATLSAACFAAADQLPLMPVADWLRGEAAQQALPDLAPRWRSEVARVLPELFAADPGLEPPRPMTESWQRQHLFVALAEAVAAAGEPLLLFLDDLQWADEDTLSWLGFLIQRRAVSRFLLLATVRTEEVGPAHPMLGWRQEVARTTSLHEISLRRLDPAATAGLAAGVLERELPADEARALFQATEGNPLFTVEMVRAGLKEGGAALPDKVRSVIEIRLSRLAPAGEELVGLAAVIGRSFTFPLLAAASPLPEAAVVAGLDELWQRQLVREQGQAQYDFSHDKIRQVAVARLSPARRQWWHRRVAAALLQVFDADLDAVHGRVADHFAAANEHERAVVHYLHAAAAASRLYAHAEAIHHLERALACLPPDDSRRAEVLAELGQVLVALGRHRQASETLQQAAELSDSPRERAHLLGRRALALSARSQFRQAERTHQEAMALLEAVPPAERCADTWRVWLEVQLSLLDALYFQAKTEQMAQVCAAMAGPLEAHGTATQRAQHSAFLVRTRFRTLRYRLTREEVARRRDILQWSREIGDDVLIADHQFGLGLALLWAGQVREAVAELDQALAQAEMLGNVPLQCRCLTYLAVAHRLQGDEARVRQTLAQLLPVAEAERKQVYLATAAALEAWLAWRAGDGAAAQDHGRRALQTWSAQEVVYPLQWLARLPLLAVALAERRLDEAQTHARAMLDPVQQRLPEDLTAALEAGARPGDPATATAPLQQACALARQHGYL